MTAQRPQTCQEHDPSDRERTRIRSGIANEKHSKRSNKNEADTPVLRVNSVRVSACKQSRSIYAGVADEIFTEAAYDDVADMATLTL